MTHEYTILTGGRILGAADEGKGAPPTAIAWALDTVLAVGGDAEVLAISRGDSRVAALRGSVVQPRPGVALLEPGAPATFSIRDALTGALLAEVAGGRLVSGAIPGLSAGQDACLRDP